MNSPQVPYDVAALVRDVITEFNREFILKKPIGLENDAALSGDDGALDSVLVVNLLANLEERIDSRFGLTIPLLDDSELTKPGGPLVKVGKLINFLERRLAEKAVA